MQALKQLIVHLLRDTANKIDAGTCELNETEATELIEVISHISMSKESACVYNELDYINSIVHEAEHIKQSMLKAYNIDESGEPPANTVAYLVEKMLQVFII